MLRLKRAYEAPDPADGERVLVDRLWPRGVPAEAACLSSWLKNLAPSPELRRWYGHEIERWPEFRHRYAQELAAPDKEAALRALADRAVHGTITLVYGARDVAHNHAVVLKEHLEQRFGT
jgi:uncharacterized protein YeaO (DUF488 family)